MEKIKAWLASAVPRLGVNNRPVVTLSYAQSLDGCLAFTRGKSYPLSSQESMALTHTLRATHDAILVGIGTIRSDNPRLTVRLVEGNNPRPVVLDTHLRMPLDCHLLQREENLPWIACGTNPDEEKQQILENHKVRIIYCQIDEHKRVSLADMLRQLGDSGIRSVMVEGGAEVISSFLEAGLADLAVVTIAPVWLNGMHLTDGKVSTVRRNFIADPSVTQLGDDVVVWGQVDCQPV
jgi:3,4-dihydroxy 2-butanone 4-phosphate synthase/GTP cyclohydrolase II